MSLKNQILPIPMTKVVIADNNNQQNFKNYRLQAGMIASSLEHQTPEQMYNTDPQNPTQGISTMKAFALANAEGQKIYTITQANINEILPKIQASSLTKGDIQSSVNAGKTVTVHEREVSVPGWTGTGYMVIDPNNANGAYMISGGGNGGFFKELSSLLDNLILLDEIGSVLHGFKLGFIATWLDNVADLLKIYVKKGKNNLIGALGILILLMVMTIFFEIMISILLSEVIIGIGVAYALRAAVTYLVASLFNIIVPN